MSDERTLRVEDLFHRVLELAPTHRAGFLARECAGDRALHDEIDSLLAAHDDAGAFLLQPSAPPAPQPVGVGARVGRWILVRELGAGGMGTVFLGERADGEFEQQVAIKLIRAAFATSEARDELARRFLVERQHLAHLDHPHVAKLFDGGTTDDGTPYLVMEYVEGEPIVAYCERRALSLAARLELFRQVCLAVQYVHSKLIAHRDLKPSNILVSDSRTPGGAPAAKLLDFGIAKLLDGELQATATIGAQRLTPAYASPEQFKSEPITTASDVYSLGVISYELVTGRLPHPTEGTTPIALARAVCEAQPPRPSAVKPGLPVELETIVLKAIEKTAERRYASAADLADDLQRFLTGHPVLARPATRGYRLRKLVARNKLTSAFAAALVLAITGSSVWLALLFSRSVRAENDAEQRRDIAERSNSILRSLFDAPDPYAAHGKDVTVVQVLDDAAPRALAGLDNQPEVRADISSVIGEAYRKIGAWDKAEPYMRAAVDGFTRSSGAEDPETLRRVNGLATLVAQLGRWQESEEMLAAALPVAERVLGPNDETTVTMLDHHGIALREVNRLEEAEHVSRESVARARATFGARNRTTWQALNSLAALLTDLGQYDEAEALYREALDGCRDATGEDERFYFSLQLSLGKLLQTVGKLEASEVELRELLEHVRPLAGDEHPDTLTAMDALASTLSARSAYDEARELYERVAAVRAKTLGLEHWETISARVGLVQLFQSMGRLDDADALLEPTFETARRALGPSHYLTVYLMHDRVQQARLREQWKRAIDLQEQLVGVCEQAFGATHKDTLAARHNLGGMLQMMGEFEKAETVQRAVFEDMRKVHGPAHVDTLMAMSNLASTLRGAGKVEAALTMFEELFRVADTALSEDQSTLGWYRYTYGRALDDAGRREEAERELQRGFDGLMRTLGPRHESTQRAGAYFAEFLDRYGETERANAVREALEASAPPPQK